MHIWRLKTNLNGKNHPVAYELREPINDMFKNHFVYAYELRKPINDMFKNHFVYVPGLWEMTLHCNAVSLAGRIHIMIPVWCYIVWSQFRHAITYGYWQLLMLAIGWIMMYWFCNITSTLIMADTWSRAEECVGERWWSIRHRVDSKFVNKAIVQLHRFETR